MPDTPLPSPPRRYTERDTDAILRRAAELQASGDAPTRERGLTLRELEGIAQEAGIEPSLIQQAARELEQRTASARSPFLGAPTRISVERVVPGELTEEAWEVMVPEIQRVFGVPGLPSRLGKTWTWAVANPVHHAGWRGITITATVRGGKTTFRADEPMGQVAGALFGGIMGGMGGGGSAAGLGIGMGAFNSPAVAVALVITMLGSAYGVARTIFSRVVRSRTQQLSQLLDQLAAAVPPAATPPSGTSPE